MCGIAGFLRPYSTEFDAQQTLVAMTNALAHRGPDADGIWHDPVTGIGLGHRRLSIIDLSEAGAQPMASPSGRFLAIYNGEIYNYGELRDDLDQLGATWRGHSDTEVVLAGFEQWGIEATLQRCNGMFTFAIWDRQEHELTLARDRIGIKPLYYGWAGDTFLFGSTLDALCTYPGFERGVDRGALGLLLRFGYIPAPHAIFEDARKLEAGRLLTVRAGAARGEVAVRRFWDLRSVVTDALENQFEGSDDDALEALDALLRDSVQKRMLADVPLGAFLSGGIDSSLVVSLMQAISSSKVKTFSIGFEDPRYNEAEVAAQVARHLGTDHTELYMGPAEALDLVPRLPDFFDEPFADSSQLPTYLVSRLARREVTVSLSGDGGDELFYGYNRYPLGHSRYRRLRRLPRPIRKLAAAGLTSTIGRGASAGVANLLARFGVGPGGSGLLEQTQKLGGLLGADSDELFYYRLFSKCQSPATLVPGAPEEISSLNDPAEWARLGDFRHVMMYQDIVSYLADDILVKLDRASMAVSLEGRVPLLDHRVVEFAWRLPHRMKARDGESKWLLRRLLGRYVPDEVRARPKQGFSVPIEDWVRGPLRDWAESLLDPARLADEGYFDANAVRGVWSRHLAGAENSKKLLWSVLMFQAWLDRERPGNASSSVSETLVASEAS